MKTDEARHPSTRGVDRSTGHRYSFRESELPFRIPELDGEETLMRIDADRGRIRSFSWRNWFAHGA
jgi:hypothetical protein